ncbi:RluA family pseudouridine synthase [Rheinheimera sp. MMS21-TC3]|uniref:RluA family pseudouridine synthase n=1 Tax=Rheinheimera sp. MMS21-TC3 TaxID=3072790 RepID=UPI0028C3F62C|nr:RluA family pseudouridine synthase [Rheinheimera sp. MMS21-TC3]WNO60741.1 RluA family pseudouridine synthase [Rheinheimera sp. MMS21-TC3]
MSAPFNYQPPQQPWLDIIFADKDLLVLNKPSGLLSVPGRGEHLADSLLSRVQAEYGFAQIVNRLDLATSGLVVIALRRKAERHLKQQFAKRQVHKRYLAVIWGQLQHQYGTVDLPLSSAGGDPPKNYVCYQQGKAAITHYRLLQQFKDSALVELTPITGRSHQLRVHMQALGLPIVGDRFYASEHACAAAPRLLLHAAHLQLQQPYTGQVLNFSADSDFVTAAGCLIAN